MVQGLKFLSKKGFNPQNQTNRKQVWEAQQASKLEQERIRRREDELKREREDEEICQIQHGDGSQAQLRFMYDAPPGLEKTKQEIEEDQKSENNKSNSQSKDVTQSQPGDDAAAAAFRRMLASSVGGSLATNEEEVEDDCEPNEESSLKFTPVLQGSKMDPALESNPKKNQGEGDQRSALEKAVGRKDRGGALTLDEQLARFPQLKNAPMAKGMSSTDVNVSFKPLGAQLRNVRCLACGQWGHSRGDRECSVTGWNPFAMTGPARVAPSNNSTVINPPDSKKSKRRYSDTSSRSHDSDSSEDSRIRRKRKSKKRKKSLKESRRRHKESSRRHRRRRSRSRSESPRSRDRDKKRRSKSQSSR
ncbi:unnamed protein product [Cylindrotheca closterium]|uniref:CBF1-interacting co-repressor CIR N-terminal domain-containing protein n=1 Tax=Cylindrotheca closterium TaxID=2856 RepID=A0AAD2FTT9_9STRA|nr:unnamed protein product [Cylindrotheca closterium]